MHQVLPSNKNMNVNSTETSNETAYSSPECILNLVTEELVAKCIRLSERERQVHHLFFSDTMCYCNRVL